MNLGQVYTKRMVADFMTGLFTIADGSGVLDPCMGHGVFIHSLLSNTDYHVTGVEIDAESFRRFDNPAPERCTLRQGDFFDVEGEFDGIIMNPPYVRQEEIDQMAPLGVTKQKLQSACGLMTISTKANLYMYFILRSILLLRDGGELIAIFPNSWTNTPVGRQFREQMVYYGSITDFINVEGEAFEGSPMVDVCIMKFVKGCMGTTTCQVMRIVGDTYTIETDKGQDKSRRGNLVKLKATASIRRGITTGANKFFVNPPLFTQEHLVSILSSPKDFSGYSTKHCRKDNLLAIQSTAVLNEEEATYLHNSAIAIQKEGKPRTLKQLIEAGQPWYYITIPEPAQIIFSYIVRSNLKFVLNEGKCNVRDNFYMISSTRDPLLLLALLNNYHVYVQLENCGKTYGKGLLKLQKYDIDDIELPRLGLISESDNEKLVGLAKALVDSGDERRIEDITAVLAPYYGVENAKERFAQLRKKRLTTHE